MQPAHCIITKRVVTLRGSCFCEKYSTYYISYSDPTTQGKRYKAIHYDGFDIGSRCSLTLPDFILLYFSQKQLPRKMKSRLLIIKCAGYISWQLFLRRLYSIFKCSQHLNFILFKVNISLHSYTTFK